MDRNNIRFAKSGNLETALPSFATTFAILTNQEDTGALVIQEQITRIKNMTSLPVSLH